MFNKALLYTSSGDNLLVNYLEFTAAQDGSNVNLFYPSYDAAPSSWKVLINGSTTTQNANSLKFAKGDTVRINYDSTRCRFDADNKDYFVTIKGALPISTSVFFNRCFYGCSSLTSIPSNLFANNPNATNFRECFKSCSSLTSVPEGLFDNNPNVTDFGYCFMNCYSLIVKVHIGSEVVKICDKFAYGTKSKGTVYVPRGSTTATTFKQTTNANVNVIEE